MPNTFTFGGLISSTYKAYISGSGTYDSPERDYTIETIPGRNGDLVLDNHRFLNIDVKYPAFICKSFQSNLESLRSALSAKIGYQKLSDTYHPGEYRLGMFTKGITVKPTKNLFAGEFDITFNCKPQRFLDTGDQKTTFTADGSISNPTLFESKPIITVTGYGTLTIGSQTITIENQFASVTIDSDLGDCYSGSDNANLYVSFGNSKLPVLVPGTNNITITGSITKVEITPRWFVL